MHNLHNDGRGYLNVCKCGCAEEIYYSTDVTGDEIYDTH